jgi:Uma2 family endonuclease
MAAGENQVPEFVIEIILKTDNINRVNRKVQNYREAKVAVIWHVFPELEEVHIYHDDKMVILKGTRICSAAPILSDFEITVNDVFKKPTV